MTKKTSNLHIAYDDGTTGDITNISDLEMFSTDFGDYIHFNSINKHGTLLETTINLNKVFLWSKYELDIDDDKKE